MPKPQTPLAIAEANGAAEHNPKRYEQRKNSPQPSGPLGDPPNHFDDVDRDLWNEVASMPAPGVLTSADRLLVEITVGLLRRLRLIPRARRADDDDDDKQQYERAEPLKAVELGHLRACLGSMGLTPADRGRVSGSNEPQEEDPADVLTGAPAFTGYKPN